MSLVVFMRGVNVGSAKRFQPSLLARELGHLGVSNLGAAGTFVVRGTLAESALRAEFLRRLPFACELLVSREGSSSAFGGGLAARGWSRTESSRSSLE